MSIKLILPFLVLSSISIAGLAQDTNLLTRKISAIDVQRDLHLLKDTLDSIHPGLYWYRSKPVLDRIFDSCIGSVQDSMTVPQTYLLTSYLVASIEDGHANARLPKDFQKIYYSNVGIFPAEVLFIHNRAYVFCCKQHKALEEAELCSINGVDMATIITKLFAYITSDGAIQSRKNWEMPDNFPFLYNEVFGRPDSYAITYRDKSGTQATAVLQADLLKNVVCGTPFPRPNHYLSLEYKSGNIAVLTIKTFFDGFLQQTGESFSGFLDSAFKDINAKHVKQLLIDVRNNQGGNDGNGALLCAYLVHSPFRYYISQETTKEKFSEDDHPNLRIQNAQPAHYDGKVYVLTNGRSFSASAEFAAFAQSNRHAIFIGEEVGGGYYGDISGDDAIVTLPDSQITCRIPEVKYIMAVKKAAYPDRGVIPDYPVYPTIADFVEGTDSQLTSALKVIEKSK